MPLKTISAFIKWTTVANSFMFARSFSIYRHNMVYLKSFLVLHNRIEKGIRGGET